MTTLMGSSVDGAVEDGGDLTHLVGEGGEFFGKDGLHAVGESFVRLVMDFDEEAIGADSDGGSWKRENFVALAGSVGRIDEDRKVAALFDGRYDGEVERVARKIGEGAHAALTENDVVVAFGEDVFGGHEEFVERGGHTALEENGLFGAARAVEQGKILHVARADLDDVGVFFDEVEAFVVDGFGDDAEAKLFADLHENFQAGFAETLEAVRGSAGLVSAAAKEPRAGFLDALSDGQALLFGFDGAGAGGEGNVLAADDHVAWRWGDS